MKIITAVYEKKKSGKRMLFFADSDNFIFRSFFTIQEITTGA